MTEIELRDRLIDAGIASLQKYEHRQIRRAGGIHGLERCRAFVERQDYLICLTERWANEASMLESRATPETYWYHRAGTIQIEFMLEQMKVAWQRDKRYSARAIRNVARILGGNDTPAGCTIVHPAEPPQTPPNTTFP